jgi:glyoxalase family protein
MQPLPGIHHITAMASKPQANVDFYHNFLGQRLIKTTVNFDDPGTYHFYYGDEVGTPGTILTFFPWPHAARGRRGNGEVAASAYTICPESVDYWLARLAEHGVTPGEPQKRFGADVIPFQDPDGMIVELVVDESPAAIQPWAEGPVPAEHVLRGFHSATLWVAEVAGTADLLTKSMGYEFAGQEGSRYRFHAAGSAAGSTLDLLERPGQPHGRLGAGSVHHIAFRTANDEEQQAYLTSLRQRGYGVSPVMDRQYFHSIYFRAPSGVLFEIATDPPGFTYDEPVAELGTHLKLPPWLEPSRAQIRQMLPAFELKPVQREVDNV